MNPTISSEITIRVRYAEADRMGYLHHANYAVYFEQGRVELLRARGFAYRDLEDQGYLMALTHLSIRYHKPARFDDELRLVTTLGRATMVSVEHAYALHRGEDLLAQGTTTLVCVTREGTVQKLHPELLPAHLR